MLSLRHLFVDSRIRSSALVFQKGTPLAAKFAHLFGDHFKDRGRRLCDPVTSLRPFGSLVKAPLVDLEPSEASEQHSLFAKLFGHFPLMLPE